MRLGGIRHTEEATHNIDKACRYFGISRISRDGMSCYLMIKLQVRVSRNSLRLANSE
jgi:hypothetical protein